MEHLENSIAGLIASLAFGWMVDGFDLGVGLQYL